MTHDEAAALVCGRCRSGEPAVRFTPGYFYHANPFIRCEATPIHIDKAEQEKR